MNEQLEAIAAQKKKPFPTPPVGYSVQWYEGNDQRNPRAAIVTKIEDPGKVTLTIFPPNSLSRHKQGVWHASHEVHQIPGNPQTHQNGSWDYPPGTKIPNDHYRPHLDYLEKKENAILEAEIKREELIKKREELKTAGAK